MNDEWLNFSPLFYRESLTAVWGTAVYNAVATGDNDSLREPRLSQAGRRSVGAALRYRTYVLAIVNIIVRLGREFAPGDFFWKSLNIKI